MLRVLDGRAGRICRAAATAVAIAACSPQVVLAQGLPPLPQFIADRNLSDTNLGRATIAVQTTCAELIAIGANDTAGTGQENELWRRCNELVITARDLNAGAATGGRTLGYTDGDDLLAALQQVNGEEVQASANMAQNASYDQFSTIGARLAALRGGTGSVASVAGNIADFMVGSGGGASADGAASPFSPWGWFLRGTFTSGDREASDPGGFGGAEDGFEYDQYGLTVGVDYQRGGAVWGLALGYNSYEVDMDTVGAPGISGTSVVEGGSIESDTVNATFFYDLSTGNNVYFSALAGFGTQSFDVLRNFTYFTETNVDPTVTDQRRVMTAAPDGDTKSAALTIGRSIVRGSVVIDPYIGLTFDRIKIDGYAETDSGNAGVGLGGMQLAYDDQYVESLRGRLGIQISNNINTGFGSVRPMFSADWYHEFQDDPQWIRAKYAIEDELAGQGDFSTGFGDCVSCFSLVSEAPESDFFVVGLGIAATTRRGLQSFLMLESLLGHENLDAYALTVGVRGQF